MSIDEGLIGWIEEATAPLGYLSWRKMFGGAALYLDGMVFAIAARGELWLKSDAQTAAAFEEAGCGRRFTGTTRDGRERSMNYRPAPSDVYDDAEAMQHWAGLALAASRRAKRPVSRRQGR